MALKNEREYRSISMTDFRAVGNKKGDYIVEGYASKFNTYCLFDDGELKIYERIEPTAFEGTDFTDCVFNLNHTGRVYARTKNGTVQPDVDKVGLHTVIDLSKTTNSREAYEDIDCGLYDQMSFAFVVDDEEYDQRSHTRIIRHIAKVYDVSAVSVPANPATSISARDWLNGAIDAEKQAERLERERKKKQLLIMLEVQK